MKENKNLTFEILLKDGGELTKDYKELSNVLLWNKPLPESMFLKNFFYIANRVFIDGWRRRKIIRKLLAKKFDLIYANTLDTAELITILGKSLQIPCVCHVHELEYTIQTYCGAEKFKTAQPFISQYIAVAKSVGENLHSKHKVTEQQIHVVPPPVNLDLLKLQLDAFDAVATPESKKPFMVVGSGLAGWRKGTDLFLLVAKIVRDLSPQNDIKFQWVGHVDKILMEQYVYDIKMEGLQDSVEFTGQKENSIPFYKMADVFLLTSREDPFPLVCIESAALTKPLISFNSTGGIPQFIIDNDAGSVVPYMSLELMAQEIIRFSKDRKLGHQKGINGSKSLREFDLPVVGAKIYEIIKNISLNR